MNPARAARRVLGRIVRNWPLKVAATALAVLLYGTLVATQGSRALAGPLEVLPVAQPSGTIVTSETALLDEIRYLAPPELGTLTSADFRVTVDLAGLQPSGEPVRLPVSVTPSDPRVTVLGIRPETVVVVLDASATAEVPVGVETGTVPPGLELGETLLDPVRAVVRGPASAVRRVAAVRVEVALDPGGLDVDRDVVGDAVDATGARVTGVEIDPGTIRVMIPLYTDRESRTVPVAPVVAGTPAPGFRIAGIEALPIVATVEGDEEELVLLVAAPTAPVQVGGATRDVTATVALALPSGIVALGDATVTVVVRIVPVTETRTFVAGLRLDGRAAGLGYALSASTVLVTLFGPTAALDRIAAAPLVVGVPVAGLEPGVREVTVVPVLPSDVSVVALDPPAILVTIGAVASPSPVP